jgi:hypothetical protein
MSKAIEKLQAAQQRAMAGRFPKLRFPLPCWNFARRGSHAQYLVSARMPESVFNQRWARRHFRARRYYDVDFLSRTTVGTATRISKK